MKKILIIIPILFFLFTFTINTVSADEATTLYTKEEWQIVDFDKNGTQLERYTLFNVPTSNRNMKSKLIVVNGSDYGMHVKHAGQSLLYVAPHSSESVGLNSSNTLSTTSNNSFSVRLYNYEDGVNSRAFDTVPIFIYSDASLTSDYVVPAYSVPSEPPRIFTFVSSFIECILSVLSTIINFIMTNGHEIVLVGVIGALVFAILGFARHFLKGV